MIETRGRLTATQPEAQRIIGYTRILLERYNKEMELLNKLLKGSDGSGHAFEGILSSIGNMFGGFFADRGTLKASQFAMVNECRPEVAKINTKKGN